jgi:Fe-S cluster assembly iron-binding protein IscA
VEVFVLELTEQARRMVGELRRQRGLPHGGLRIARAGSGLGLWMSLESGPREGDHVLHLGEAVLYLDATAKHRLAGQTLDARTNAQGAAFFL